VFSFKTSIPKLKTKIEEEIRLLQGGFVPDLVGNVINPAVEQVKSLTPRSEGGGSQGGRDTRGRFLKGSRHLQDGWVQKTIGGGGKARIPVLFAIWNNFTHKATGEMRPGAQLKTASGETKDYTLLDIIEFGSHHRKPIVPVNAKALRFEVGGKVVFSKNVDHPGTRPYAPVRLTRLWLAKAIAKFADKWARKIATAWD
jgi:hypothetical protein